MPERFLFLFLWKPMQQLLQDSCAKRNTSTGWEHRQSSSKRHPQQTSPASESHPPTPQVRAKWQDSPQQDAQPGAPSRHSPNAALPRCLCPPRVRFSQLPPPSPRAAPCRRSPRPSPVRLPPHLSARAFSPHRPAAEAGGWRLPQSRRRQQRHCGTAAPQPGLMARRSTRHIARHAGAANSNARQRQRHRIARSPHCGAGCPGGGTNGQRGERRGAQANRNTASWRHWPIERGGNSGLANGSGEAVTGRGSAQRGGAVSGGGAVGRAASAGRGCAPWGWAAPCSLGGSGLPTSLSPVAGRCRGMPPVTSRGRAAPGPGGCGDVSGSPGRSGAGCGSVCAGQEERTALQRTVAVTCTNERPLFWVTGRFEYP